VGTRARERWLRCQSDQANTYIYDFDFAGIVRVAVAALVFFVEGFQKIAGGWNFEGGGLADIAEVYRSQSTDLGQ
jgi:hypothetical protein